MKENSNSQMEWRVKLGCGNRIRFWQDCWVGEDLLMNRFSGLYVISRNQHDLVFCMFDLDLNCFSSSKFVWKRRLRIGEQQLFDDLLQLLESMRCYPRPDRFMWVNSELFTPSGFRKQMGSSLAIVHSRADLMGRVWKTAIPPRIQFFFWLLARDRISSKANLLRIGMLSRNQSLCSLCLLEETSMHIILHCQYAWSAWSFILELANIAWVVPASLDDFFFQWYFIVKKKYRSLWQLIWFFTIWEFWKARNRKLFQDELLDFKSLVYSSICKAVEFYKSHNKGFSYSGNDVFRSLDYFCNNSISL
ncbi:uncharacterized protein LOC126656754 [Mercurialis annua]|uniref:uncharacterized protein LOC126656754 n=1 Tax=Mercurialis annua TaxID=3986 RepID=UPI0021603E87|nr:uncharacterized protein LOC126656754 [Mercurialis annua]